MMILTIPEGIEQPVPVKDGLSMEGGQDYLCTNAFAGQMLLTPWKIKIKGQEWSLRMLIRAYSIDMEPFDPTEDWNNKNIWIYRGAGYGDILLLTPLIRELRSRWPESWIHVVCGSQFHDMLNGLNVICEYIPIPYNKQTRIDGLINCEELVEGDPRARELNMAQLFASSAGITLTSLKPEYHVTPDERLWALNKYPLIGLPRIGIQFMSSALYRTYPHMPKVMMELAKQAHVFLIGAPGQVVLNDDIPNVTNLMADKLSFRQSAAVVSTCDVCVSPDSALVHLCSALGVPCVGIYGPFPSSLRVTSENCFSFNGVAPCAPCFFHADHPDQFPRGMPCEKVNKCIALDSIDPDEIIKKVLSMPAGHCNSTPNS